MDVKQSSADLNAGKGLVRLFNQVEGSFLHTVVTSDGEKKTFTLAGKSFGKVPKELADHWLKLFPTQVVTDTEAHAKVDAKQVELDAAQKEIADLKAKLAKSKPMTAAELKEAKADAKAQKEADDKAAEEQSAADKKAADDKAAKDSV